MTPPQQPGKRERDGQRENGGSRMVAMHWRISRRSHSAGRLTRHRKEREIEREERVEKTTAKKVKGEHRCHSG